MEMWKNRPVTISKLGTQADFLGFDFSLAHRALCAAAIFFRAAADMTGFFLGVDSGNQRSYDRRMGPDMLSTRRCWN